MIIETEIKLTIDSKDCELLIEHPLLKRLCQKGPYHEHLLSYYYDTPEYDLLQEGYVLRVRQMGQGFSQTIKSDDKSHQGLHKRKEWLHDVPSILPDVNVFPDETIRNRLVHGDLSKKLVPLFATDFMRQAWLLRVEPNTDIELALDLGEVRAGSKTTPICEVELELFQGEEQVLFDLAKTLKRDLNLREDSKNKAQLGFELLASQKD